MWNVHFIWNDIIFYNWDVKYTLHLTWHYFLWLRYEIYISLEMTLSFIIEGWNIHFIWNGWLVGWLFGFYGISTFVGYLMPNLFLCKYLVLFQTIQFSISTVSLSKTFQFQAIRFIQTVLILVIQFSISTDVVYTQLNFKTVLYQTIQFSVSTLSMSKAVPFQTIQFSISTQYKCKYSLIVKNISISSYSV